MLAYWIILDDDIRDYSLYFGYCIALLVFLGLLDSSWMFTSFTTLSDFAIIFVRTYLINFNVNLPAIITFFVVLFLFALHSYTHEKALRESFYIQMKDEKTAQFYKLLLKNVIPFPIMVF